MEGVNSLKPREHQTVTFTGGPINIANNPTSKPHLGGNCISNTSEYYLGAMLAYTWKSGYLTPDTFGWPLGMSYKLNHRPLILI